MGDDIYAVACQIKDLKDLIKEMNKNLSRISEELAVMNERSYLDGN